MVLTDLDLLGRKHGISPLLIEGEGALEEHLYEGEAVEDQQSCAEESFQ